MTFFSKLFGKRTEPIISPTAPEMEKELIPRDLFIEERDPKFIEGEKTKVEPQSERSLLDRLLDRDYHAMGHKDGYHLKDLGRMDKQVEIIISDFRLAYDKIIQDLDLAMEALKPHLTERMKEEAPELYSRYRISMDYYGQKKQEMYLQKDLAATGEGYIEYSVRCYKAGFIEGFTFYTEEEKMFKHFKLI
ncbi:hypothetical protein [Cecembia calidifontis]|uniref:Uncharacterized protein n=1 Tax=Cecembia calidifontis TaxID=1187080 RepID=A0A4Q7PC48_9BACT|nr:hypothetical protein [Cecembia calidifontis]RZS97150.1 hypothetical protein BC751_2747 [Cecembia calidifontis]